MAARVGALDGWIVALAVLSGLAALAGEVAEWPLELVRHFAEPHLALIAVLVGVGLLRPPLRRFVVLAAAPAILLVPRLSPPAAPGGAGPAVSLLSFNLSRENSSLAEARAAILGSDADLVLLFELTEPILRGLGDLEPYRPVVVAPEPGNFGLGLFVRPGPSWTVERARVRRDLDLLGRPPSEDLAIVGSVGAIEALLRVEGRAVHLLGIHPVPPVSPDLADSNRSSLAGVALWTQSHAPSIVAGDFNSTLGGRAFEPLHQAGLRSAAVGRDRGPTWPSSLPVGIAIDHVLVSPGLGIDRFERRPGPGSDHRAVFARVVVLGGGE